MSYKHVLYLNVQGKSPVSGKIQLAPHRGPHASSHATRDVAVPLGHVSVGARAAHLLV